jgi:hypothetical protein
LHIALVKLARVLGKENEPFSATRLPVSSHRDVTSAGSERWGANDNIEELRGRVELLFHACSVSVQTELCYRNAAGQKSLRSVDPSGLYLLAGQWYLVAFDHQHKELRVFSVTRILEARLLSDTFTPPENFSVARWVELPFRLSGGAVRDARALLRLPPELSSNALAITRGKGELEPATDGSLIWTISYESTKLPELITFALQEQLEFLPEEHGARAHLRTMLEQVVKAHE